MTPGPRAGGRDRIQRRFVPSAALLAATAIGLSSAPAWGQEEQVVTIEAVEEARGAWEAARQEHTRTVGRFDLARRYFQTAQEEFVRVREQGASATEQDAALTDFLARSDALHTAERELAQARSEVEELGRIYLSLLEAREIFLRRRLSDPTIPRAERDNLTAELPFRSSEIERVEGLVAPRPLAIAPASFIFLDLDPRNLDAEEKDNWKRVARNVLTQIDTTLGALDREVARLTAERDRGTAVGAFDRSIGRFDNNPPVSAATGSAQGQTPPAVAADSTGSVPRPRTIEEQIAILEQTGERLRGDRVRVEEFLDRLGGKSAGLEGNQEGREGPRPEVVR